MAISRLRILIEIIRWLVTVIKKPEVEPNPESA
jgi:hypothetical protein